MRWKKKRSTPRNIRVTAGETAFDLHTHEQGVGEQQGSAAEARRVIKAALYPQRQPSGRLPGVAGFEPDHACEKANVNRATVRSVGKTGYVSAEDACQVSHPAHFSDGDSRTVEAVSLETGAGDSPRSV